MKSASKSPINKKARRHTRKEERDPKTQPKRTLFHKADSLFASFEWRTNEKGNLQFRCVCCETGWLWGDAHTAYTHVGVRSDAEKGCLVSVPGKGGRHQDKLELYERKQQSARNGA